MAYKKTPKKNIREERPELVLYTLEEVAELLGLTHRTVWQYVKDGKLKAVMIGNKWRVSKENYSRFINGEG